ncbi:uncharacterized protein TNCV_199731 [Trichonephila clavipes]|nr:uncharacterized protein TNCV_199731 [Trichonephila clavipes]
MLEKLLAFCRKPFVKPFSNFFETAVALQAPTVLMRSGDIQIEPCLTRHLESIPNYRYSISKVGGDHPRHGSRFNAASNSQHQLIWREVKTQFRLRNTTEEGHHDCLGVVVWESREKDYNDDHREKIADFVQSIPGFEECDEEDVKTWMACDAEECGFQMLNDDDIVTFVQEESAPVDDETDEDEDNNNNESSKGQANARFLR